jgi:hypothetical protein
MQSGRELDNRPLLSKKSLSVLQAEVAADRLMSQIIRLIDGVSMQMAVAFDSTRS